MVNYVKNLEENEISAREELEQDKVIIKKFMKNYGDEWRELGED